MIGIQDLNIFTCKWPLKRNTVKVSWILFTVQNTKFKMAKKKIWFDSRKPSTPCILYSKFDQIDVSWRSRTIHNTGLFGCASGSYQHEHSRQIAYYSESQLATHNSYIIIFKLGLSFPIIRRYWYKSSDQFLFICFWFTIDFSWRISTPKFRFFNKFERRSKIFMYFITWFLLRLLLPEIF